MDEGWANFIQNFNESSWYSEQSFSQSYTFGFNKVLPCFIYDQNLWLHMNITATYQEMVVCACHAVLLL
jgi:hypothetical protein